MQIDSTPYRYRRNADGSLDSICTTCFRTVASSDTELDLPQAEQQHRCSGEDLRQPLASRRP